MKSDDTTSKGEEGAKEFIKEKVESARWFIESIRQRHHTLMSTMRAIVAFQEDFFKHGKGLRPMILNDVADRIGEIGRASCRVGVWRGGGGGGGEVSKGVVRRG